MIAVTTDKFHGLFVQIDVQIVPAFASIKPSMAHAGISHEGNEDFSWYIILKAVMRLTVQRERGILSFLYRSHGLIMELCLAISVRKLLESFWSAISFCDRACA